MAVFYLLMASFVVMSSCTTNTCYFRRLRGFTTKQEMRRSTLTSPSGLECIMTHCLCDNPCAASYNTTSKECAGIKATSSYTMSYFETTHDSHSFVFMNTAYERATTAPSILWYLDNSTRGLNFGYKGRIFDLCNTDRFKWTAEGPRLSTRPRFGTVKLDSGAYINLIADTQQSLNFDRFSIACWTKLDSEAFKKHGYMSLVSMSPKMIDLRVRNANMNQYIELDRSQELLNFGSSLFNALNGWFHLTVTFIGDEAGKGNIVEFYINGTSSKRHTFTKADKTEMFPKKVMFFNTPFTGSVACFYIYERAVEEDEVKKLMEACPKS